MAYAADIDLRLLERFGRGDQAAFDALVARHRRRIFNLVYRMLGDREAAEDVTVEVFFQVYRSLPAFRKQSRFSTWLHRIAVNVCLQHLRRRQARLALAEVPLPAEPLVSGDDTLEIVVTKEIAAHVAAAMQALPEGQRLVVILYYLEHRSIQEIADLLGLSPNTVKTRIFYGTRTLRDKLRAQDILPSRPKVTLP